MSTLLQRLHAHHPTAETRALCNEAAAAIQRLLDQLAEEQWLSTITTGQVRSVKAAANKLLALDLENDGATCEWAELQHELANLRAALAAAKGPGAPPAW